MFLTNADTHILNTVCAGFDGFAPKRLGIAISGGSDSTALMHTLHACFGGNIALFAATVDHGLRPESAAEAAAVSDDAGRLNIPHETLVWRGWDGSGNLQDQARRARRNLLARWARENHLDAVALGHTADDQAETVLMRLARSAGVDGLAGMQPVTCVEGIRFVRPLLALSRADLRDYLQRHGIGWCEDPSNADDRFDRVKVRKAMSSLSSVGITVQTLNDVAGNMAMARTGLDACTHEAARRIAQIDGGDVILDAGGVAGLPGEIARRLVLRSLMWVSGAEYAPRRDPMASLLGEIRDGGSATLSGCIIATRRNETRIAREYNAVRDTVCGPGEFWDGRWRLSGRDSEGLEVRALGETGLRNCPEWRETGRPKASLLASPSVWRGNDLVAAPLAGLASGWDAARVGGAEGYFSAILSH